MDAKTLLTDARKYVDMAWIQGDYARDEYGDPCFGHETRAVCWCSLGAIQAAGGTNDFDMLDKVEQTLASVVGIRRSFIDWNDEAGRTKQEVLEAFDQAIAAS